MTLFSAPSSKRSDGYDLPFEIDQDLDEPVHVARPLNFTFADKQWSTLHNKDIPTAFEHFQAALLYDEEHLYARIGLGRCYIAMGKWEMARVHLERATRAGRVRANQDWLAWSQLSTVYQELGEFSRAYECAAVALERQTKALPVYLRGWETLLAFP